ncbi:SDR family NAD(P)-dependent oxidoreductase [Ancylobacter amanitiformis]|uniref:NAD(P)-dependent dehydrogenase (Short-subunit alcohol dehydrogenase family) n=1 Tax=Ancylobacter amanitiformis TaxID=217069 RepID=A0ABU0LT49_9HYPH|nr:SDR family oxidoreductase [Ancylobacter amanitiformis]MDQ0511815.1 NAD(P)-dependent dehydrogenase (short-subunit alcohol dehydrogenase family) [Ancylobacter amanitiformis]
MKIDLSGKTALVTGSTEGIGFAIAKGLDEAGASVVINGRTEPKVAAALAKLGPNARGRAIDLATPEGLAALVAAEPAFDIVVNNLGIFQPVDFFAADDAVWDRHWQVNVMSGVRIARAYLPGMAAKGWGRMLFLGSESGYNIPVEMIHYGVSKTADVSLARGLAKRMAGTGVTVNSILPGPTLSEGVAEMLKDEVAKGKTLEQAGIDFVKAHRPSSIIGRPATVEEVASMAVYIASPLASATTGAALRVDGGVVEFIV